MGSADNVLGQNSKDIFAKPLLQDASLLGGTASLGIQSTSPLGTEALAPSLPILNPPTTAPLALSSSSVPNLFPSTAASQTTAATLPLTSAAGIDPLTGIKSEAGVFTVNPTGYISADFLFDGGSHQGQVALFSLSGMEHLRPGSLDFIQEASRRALSNSAQGYVLISDAEEDAKFSDQLLGDPKNNNQGNYQGTKTFAMRPGDRVAMMVMPNGRISELLKNPNLGGNRRPVFSMPTAQSHSTWRPFADLTGDGTTFAIKDTPSSTNHDYNDFIFQLKGLGGGQIPTIDRLINRGYDWRASALGQQIITYARSQSTLPILPNGNGELVFNEADSSVPASNSSTTTFRTTSATVESTSATATTSTSDLYQTNVNILWRNTITGETDIWSLADPTSSTLTTPKVVDKGLHTAVTPLLADPDWQIHAAGDANRDQQSDLIWRNRRTGENALWTMNGNTRLSSAYLMQISDQDWQIQGAGDFDRDHNIDLVWRNTRTGENAIWYMDAAGTTIARSAYLPISDQNWQIVGVGDFDSDLIPDLVWRNRQTGENSIWYMSGNTGSQRRAGLYFTQISDQNWKIEGAGDFNQDGRADLLWHNTQTGATATWLQTLPGTTQATSSSIDFRVGWLDSLPAGQSWKAVTPYVVREKRPVIEMRLQRDTDVAGDNITTDPTISGKVTAAREISELKGRLLINGTAGAIVDLKSSLERDNSFTLTRRQLEQLNQGNPLAEGRYTLELQSADKRYNRAVPTQLTFTLQPTHPPVFTSTPVLDARVVRSAGGRVIVANDEWPLSDRAFSENPQPNGHINPTVKVAADTRQFAKNIANYFTGGRPGSFLVYSDHPSITGTALTQAFHDAGHQITVSTTVSFTPELLQQYDGVFVGGFASSDPAINRARNQVLSNYVQQGGNVYLFAGTAAVGATEPMTPVQDIRFLDTYTREARTEAKVWELFLQTLGLKFDELYNSMIDSVAVNPSSHPLFRNVNQLLQSYGNSIIDLNVTDNQGTIVSTNRYGQGIFAVYDAALTNPLAYRYAVTANDPDQDSLTYSLISAPDGMSIDTNGIIRWAPREAQAGRHPVVVRVDDGHGGSTEQSFTVRVRRDPRTMPAPTNLQLAVASDSGSSNSDRVTRITTSTITGMAEAGSQVQLFQGTTLVGQSMTSETGVWQITTTALADGVNPLNAIATDSDDNVSSASETLTITIDAVEPQITLTTSLTTAPLRNDARLAGNVNGTGSAVSSLTYRWNDGPEIPITLSASDAFDQAINFVGLNNGVHTLTMTTIDAAGNVTATPFSVEVSLNFAPTDVVLSRNTISENPSSGALIGTLMTTDANLNDTHQYTLINDAGGRFQLVGNELRVAPDTVLDYETAASYTLAVRVVDSGSPSLTFDKQFTIQVGDVNERPTFTSQPLVNAETNQLYRYTIATADAENGSRIIQAAKPLPSWLSLVDQGDGTAILSGTPDTTQSGLYAIELLVVDAGGLTSTQTYLLGVDVALREGSRFHTSQSVTFTVDRPTMLSFTIEPSFDPSKNLINDAFEVALVDAKGRSLVPVIAAEREAFFNWTEGESVEVGAGATYMSATKTITLNLTGISNNTEATLVFRLLNDDQDTQTQVRIRDIQLLDAPAGTLPPVIGYSGATNATVPVTPNFNVLEDVSSSFTVEYDQTSYDAVKKLLYADIAIKNSGTYSVDVPLLVAVTHLSDPSVLIRNPDGYTPEGLPYYDFSHLVADGKLDPYPPEVTSNRSLVFYNPNGVQFTYDLVVLAQLNRKPIIEPQAIQEVVGGKVYQYAVKANDPNSDVLSYTLLSSPPGMMIDAKTGVITWVTKSTTPAQGGDIGNHAVVVRVSDNRGGTAVQAFTLSVTDTLPNRPPIFTTNPVVDAFTNQPYTYDADATDADQDSPLKYTLLSGPEGMSVDPISGVVRWTPPPVLVLGDNVLGRINVPGERNAYSFSGTIGQRIYLDLLNIPRQIGFWTLDIKSPSGKTIRSSFLNTDPNSEPVLFTLEENGNYQITVTPYDDYVGSYGFNLIDIDAVPTVRFDTPIQGKLSPGSEEDVYRFRGEKGQKLYVNVDTAQGTQFYWQLYDASNQSVGADEGYGLNPDFAVTLPSNGEYVLVLRGIAGFTEAVSYSFQIATPDLITTPLSTIDGTFIQGDFKKTGERDYYTFEGTAGQILFFDSLGASQQITARISDRQGNQVFIIDPTQDISLTSPAIVLEQNDTYTIEVDAYADNLGSYRFRLLDLNSTTAKIASLDTDIIGSFAPDQIGAEAYKFSLSQSTYLFVDGQTGTGQWTLYRANGQYVQNGFVSGDNEFSLDAGDYFLVVRGQGSEGYKLRLITPQNSPNLSPEPLTLGQVVNGTIAEKGQFRTYTFNGQVGQALFFNAIAGKNATVKIYSSFSAQPIFAGGIEKDYGPNTSGLILPATGQYRMVIDGNGDLTGDYRFEIIDLSNALAQSLDQVSTTLSGVVDTTQQGGVVHRFTLAESKNVFFEGQSDQGYWFLFGQNGQFITSGNLNSTRSALLATGEYFLVAQIDDNSVSTATPYTLKVVASSATPLGEQSLGTAITGNFAHRGQRAVYTFQASVGEPLFYDALSQDASARITVYDPTGKSVFTTQGNADQILGTGLLIASLTGTYRVEVEALTPGEYGFRFLPHSGAITATFGNALPVSFGTTKLEAQTYQFSLQSSQVIKLQGQPQTGTWTLFSSTGRPVSQASFGSPPETDLPSGNYFLVIRGDGNTTSGTVQIDTLRAGSYIAPTGTMISLGTVFDSTLQAGQQVKYLLNGTAGQQLFYDVLNSTNNTVYITLLDPDGQAIFNKNVYTDRSPVQNLTLATSGLYQFIVEAASFATGSLPYKFRFLDRATAEDVPIETDSDGKISLNPTFDYSGLGVKSYKITLTQPKYLAFKGTNSTANWSLYGPTGQVQLTGSSSQYSEMTTPLAPGEYFLIVQGNGSTSYSLDCFRVPQLVAPLTLDAVTSGTTTIPGQQNIYTFEGQLGQQLFFAGLVGGSVPVRIQDPAGYTIYSGLINQDYGAAQDSQKLILALNGTYKLIVDPSADAIGAYTFQLVSKPVTPPLTFDAQENLTIQDTFDNQGLSARAYRFKLDTDRYVFIDGQMGSGVWNLYKPDGTRVFPSAQTGVPLTSNREVQLTAGDYFLVVRGTSNTNPNYKLNLILSELKEIGPLEFGAIKTGELSKPGQQNTYTFEGTPGQQLFFDDVLLNRNTGSSPTFTLYDPTGRAIISIPSRSDQGTNGPGSGMILSMKGTYKLVVDAYEEATVPYQFRLFNKFDFRTAANELVQGASLVDLQDTAEIAGNFDSNGVGAKTYRLRLNQPQFLYFDGIQGDGIWQLYDPSGKPLNQNWNNDVKYDDYRFAPDYGQAEPSKQVPLPAGEYFLVVLGTGGINRDFRFKLTTPERKVFLPLSQAIGQTIFDQTIQEKGEQHVYTFSGRRGQNLVLTSLDTSLSGVRIRVYDSANRELLTGNSGIVLTRDDEYRVVVDGQGAIANTRYAFRFIDKAEAPEIKSNEQKQAQFNHNGWGSVAYRFNGKGDQSILIDTNAYQANYSWQLYGPGGQVLEGYPDKLNDLEDAEVKLPGNGEYLLVLKGNGNANPYRVQIFDVAAQSTHQPLPWGESVTSILQQPSQVNTYTFKGEVGQSIYLNAVLETPSQDVTLSLYSPNSTLIRQFRYSPFVPYSDRVAVVINLPEPGEYRWVVDALGDDVGQCTFTVSDLHDLNQAPPIALDTEMSATLDSAHPVRLYQLTGKAGQRLNFDALSTVGTGATWYLLDPSGGVVKAPPANSPDFTATLASDGLYTLVVIADLDQTATEMQPSFRVTDLPTSAIAPQGLGTTFGGTLLINETKSYKVQATAGMLLWLDGLTPSSNVMLQLIDPDNISGQSYNTGVDKGPILVEKTGEYTVRLSGGISGGSYKFNLMPFPQTKAAESNQYIEFGNIQSGTLTSYQTQLYAFDGVAGQQLFLDGLQGQFVYATLFDANGNVVSKDGYTNFVKERSLYGPTDAEPFTLTRSGRYYFVIENRGNTDLDFGFRFLDIGSATELKDGIEYAGALSDARTQIFKLDAQAGERVFLDVLGQATTPWKLIGPDYQLIAGGERGPFSSGNNSAAIKQTGTHYLLVYDSRGNPTDYRFRVFHHEPPARDILVPGDGEASANDDNGIVALPIKLAVSDPNGAQSVQEFKLRLWEDPTNTDPVITSTPKQRFGLNDKIYQYRLTALDADGDTLTYRLLDAPTGTTIDRTTGELLWFPDSTAKPGDKVKFQVEVADRRGGKDIQTFEVEVFSQLGKIQGMVFNDLNNNGYRDTTLVNGETPDIVFAIDVSMSTGGRYLDWTKTDLKTFTSSNVSYLDMEIASAIALSEQLIAQGRSNAQVGIVLWSGGATTVDMDPQTDGIQLFTTLTADKNNNGISDLREALNTARAFGGTYFTAGLEVAKGVLDSVAEESRSHQNLLFLSDGWGLLDGDIVAQIRDAGINLKAFGVGTGAGMPGLREIDPDATQITDVQTLVDVFSGWDPRYSLEPFMENITVYLDLNNNGSLNDGEPQQVTRKDTSGYLLDGSKYYYSFDDLTPGTYTVRQLIPAGFKQTAPTTGEFTTTFTVGGDTSARHMFGLHKTDAAPNRDPIFRSSGPNASIQVGERFVYQPIVTDADADPLIYDLPLAPKGMVIDPVSGLVMWSPTASQVGQPKTVIVRVRDDKGGIALQTFQVDVVQPNQAPVITSSVAPTAQPRVGRTFQYQIEATDPDGDSLTYALVAGSGTDAYLDTQTQSLRWTPNSTGTKTFTIGVSDGKGGTAHQTLTLTAAAASLTNQAPVILSTPRQVTRLGSPYFYQLNVSDPDGDVLTYSLDTASQAKGMVLQEGVLTWLPTAAQAGKHSVQIQVSDGRLTATQTYDLDVVSQVTNRVPIITSTPTLVTNLEQRYSYDLAGGDPDGDMVIWSLEPDRAPIGMVIDPETGALRWQPTANQLGAHTIAVRITDTTGLSTVQEFALTVTGANTPPGFLSTPITRAAQNQAYRYDVVATDVELGTLTFGLGRRPTGMEIDPKTGQITWMPMTGQLGPHVVDVQVTDAQGAISTQTFEVLVGATAINQAPKIVSTPVFLGNRQSVYTYAVQAEDADGDRLGYRLLEKPLGMEIDATGRILWTPQETGTYQVVVAVEDGKMGAAQGFTLTVRENTAPKIVSHSPQVVALGTTYRYDVQAGDQEGDALTYAIDAASLAKGMTIDDRGRMAWTPTITGQHTVTITVTDAQGATAQEQVQLSVERDTIAPKVQLLASTNQGEPGSTITLYAKATDNQRVADLALMIDGQRVVIDANGQATVKLSSAGTQISATATATDAAGNQSFSEQVTIKSIDSTATFDPILKLDLSGLPDGIVTAPTAIKGSVGGEGFTGYKLEIAPIGSEEFREIATGSSTVDSGTLGTLDPSLLQNDAYTLRLTVYGPNAATYTEDTVNVAGELKLGNFRLSFTDLSIPVTGIPITLTRTYDTLTSTTFDDFGYGWRMEFRDTDLRTSLKRTPEEELLGSYPAFKDGTRVYITLPGGKREGFTFKPTADRLNSFFGAAPEAALYHPAFVADKGSTNTLTVKDVRITRSSGTSQYGGLGGNPYNPSDSLYGGVYVLTTKDGTAYEINARTGDLLTVTDTNGNTLTYTDDAIVSSTGQKVTFERDAQNRITSVKDPMGELVRYTYDAKGDLISVSDRLSNTTRMEYNGGRAHYLEKIIDPLGRTGVKTEYDENGRLKAMVDAAGKSVNLAYEPANSLQTVEDQLGNQTTYEYDDRGNVVTEIDAEGKVIKRKYNDNNDVLEESVISDRSDNPLTLEQEGFITTYTYDGQQNKLTQTDALGNTTYYTYGEKGRLLTETDALGRTTTNKYGKVTGNLIETKNAFGVVTGFDYGLTGNLFTLTDANAKNTQFTYDRQGNVKTVTDANANVTTYEYDANGNKLSETRLVTVSEGVQQTVTTTWTYDKDSRIKTMTDAQQHMTVYGYDPLGRQVWVLDARGYLTQSKYNEKGELETALSSDGSTYRYNAQTDQLEQLTTGNPTQQRRMQYTYDSAGRKTVETDALGRVTRYLYDKVGRLTEVLLPDLTPDTWEDNARTRTEYYTDGLVKAQIDERGNRTEFRYDADGRQIEVIYADQTPETLSDNPRTKYEYDKAGQQTAVIDALNHRTQYEYDDLGRLKRTMFEDKTVTETEYDKLGRRTAMVDQNGTRTEYEYDALGRLIGVKNALNDWTRYTYNEAGNLMSMLDAEQQMTRYEYDKLGRRTTTILPLLQRSMMTFDAVGNTKTVTDFNGKTVTYDYDSSNWLTQKHFQDESQVAYTYTLNGQRNTVAFKTASSQTTELYDWDYDERDRLTKRTDTIGTGSNQTTRAIEYGYDVAGNKTWVKTASGTTNYTYDERNRLDSVRQDGVLQVDYDYDAVNNLIRTKLGNGIEEIRQYDDLNRLKYLENHKLNAEGTVGSVISSFAYTLDKVGNRTAITEQNGRTMTYTYDDLYRLTKEVIDEPNSTNDDRTNEYHYDLVGNRLWKKETLDSSTTQTDYQYDANDRLEWEKVVGVTTSSYIYDANGSTLTKTENGSTTTHVWNDEKRLIAATVTDANGAVGQQLQYRYNDDGIRVSSSVNGQETRYLLDEVQPYAQVLEEYAPNGMVAVFYVHGNDLISQMQGGQTTYYHVDGLGSTTELTDTAGNVVSSSRYDAFGNGLKNEGAITTKYQFAGEQFDPGLGSYYLRQRHYATNSGRFTRQDTYEGDIGNPLTLHKYVYAHNNPVVHTDPLGLFTMTEISATESISRELERQRTTTTVITLQKSSRQVIEVVKAVARSYAATQEIAESLARSFKIPMLVTGWEIPSTASHITRSLLFSGYTRYNSGGSLFGSPQLSPVLSHVREGTNDRSWYKKLPVYKNRPAGTSIDEYPYASTAQGGEENYNNNMVSLKAVPVREQNRQGGIMPNFYRWGMVGDGGISDMTSWYLNFAHFGSMSYMLDRSGNKRFFSYGA